MIVCVEIKRKCPNKIVTIQYIEIVYICSNICNNILYHSLSNLYLFGKKIFFSSWLWLKIVSLTKLFNSLISYNIYLIKLDNCISQK